MKGDLPERCAIVEGMGSEGVAQWQTPESNP